ncbi:MAG TPA: ribosome-associated translation inhibitor RaiA [Bacteroidetes bacterium]|nr:ribosome-associated translation inhibitor RaiA [Bacteroidota bacterium]
MRINKELSMNTTVTSRHFKAHSTLIDYAKDAVEKLERYYDGIIKCEVKLSFEKASNSVKRAEIILSVYKNKIAAIHESEEFHKSIDGAVDKVLARLKKYKDKLHAKDRKQVREVRSKI